MFRFFLQKQKKSFTTCFLILFVPYFRATKDDFKQNYVFKLQLSLSLEASGNHIKRELVIKEEGKWGLFFKGDSISF